MALDSTVARQYLKESDFRALFIQALGWDHHHAPPREVLVDDRPFTLGAVAEKRGVQIFECGPDATGTLADYPSRRRIEKQVAQWAYEHLIIFTDSGRRTQVWQWVLRQPGRPAACREHTYCTGQPGDALIQKLDRITFPLSAEEGLTLSGVTVRLRDAFDKDRVTKRFYERFKTEHAAFLSFVKGIPVAADREWYASLMLNRLMFVYFIEKKGFLDGDTAYLRSRLRMMRERKGKDKFLSFYRHFLLRLFHEGLGQQKRDSDLDQLLGKVPYLNGGLFDVHQLERDNPEIRIADAAFERLFDFFDAYQWHLDDRPLAADNEINPDVLGYIFEKYVNQKQMGAYYTKEDITGYIAQNTVIPFLFDAAEKKCAIAFRPDGGVWGLLRQEPDRYIYEAVRKGVDLSLPDEIAAGLDEVSKREGWNRPAAPDFALPTETWREHVARRRRCHEIRAKARNGDVHSINDLITLNLDIRQFAQDAIQSCEGPELVRAFYDAIERVSVLDPTCGSGAFLFAALKVLEPLYEACLDRMQAFVDDLDRSGQKHRPEKFADFRKLLERVKAHPNRTYFILKSIIIGNLSGVDIMEEAVEICKLRLFLKLVAQVERVEDIEPLPDIDFNIRAGNTLVGFATYDDVKWALASKLDFDQSMERIEERAADVDRLSAQFRLQQTEFGGLITPGDKQALRDRLSALDAELNRYLAGDYAVNDTDEAAYRGWLRSHFPFHWFVEFYRNMKAGGFDVIIGNPPYVEMADVADQYSIKGLTLTETGNLYSVCLERFAALLHEAGRMGVIVPISAVSTPRMSPLMQLLSSRFFLHLSHYAVRPGKLFVGTDMNLTIVVGQKRGTAGAPKIFSTDYNRWSEASRGCLFANLEYAKGDFLGDCSSIPKTGSDRGYEIRRKIGAYGSLSRLRAVADGDTVYYHSGGRYFRKCLRQKLSNEYKELRLKAGFGDAAICILSSSFYYWLWIAISDCYHVTKRDIEIVPVPDALIGNQRLRQLAPELLADLERHAERRVRTRADGNRVEEVNYHVGRSKSIIDEIDRTLAPHYGLTDEELDFIINYDIKYRRGQEAEECEE
jgi:hypothetical protein